MSKYLTIPQFARMIGVKECTAYKWIDYGFVFAKDFADGGKNRCLRIPASELARVRANKKAGIPVKHGVPDAEQCAATA